MNATMAVRGVAARHQRQSNLGPEAESPMGDETVVSLARVQRTIPPWGATSTAACPHVAVESAGMGLGGCIGDELSRHLPPIESTSWLPPAWFTAHRQVN